MNKTRIFLSVSAILSASIAASPSFAQDNSSQDWFGVFAEHYSTDDDKPALPNDLGNGYGFGLEYGVQFSPKWAGRIEWSHLNIDHNAITDGSGYRIGVDALYFLAPESRIYAFTGVKYENIDQSYRLANLGIGKQTQLSENWALITEAAMYHDFGENYQDYGLKLGLAYTFGAAPAAAPVPSPVQQAPKVDNDTDKDGVSNAMDKCPSSAPGARVDSMGCADDDSDGVNNYQDQCPNTPKEDKVDKVGCGVFEQETHRIVLNALFANNSAVIQNPKADKFQEFADFMDRYRNTSAEIAGHASAPGDADYNMDLSERRAQAVRQLLIDDYGVDPTRVSAKGYGETQLLDTANTAEANRKNRRIHAEIKVVEQVKVKRED